RHRLRLRPVHPIRLTATQFVLPLSPLGLGWLGEPELANALLSFDGHAGPALSPGLAHSLAFGIAFLAIAFVQIVLGELVPRGIALRRPERIALWLVRPLPAFARLFRPFTWA